MEIVLEIAADRPGICRPGGGLYDDNGRCQRLCHPGPGLYQEEFPWWAAWKVIDEDFPGGEDKPGEAQCRQYPAHGEGPWDATSPSVFLEASPSL